MRVLIAEDHFLVAEALRLSLTEAGHEVVGIAADAPEAVHLAGKHRPDVTLMDIQLARGTSGIDAARAIMARHGSPSLFVTANPGSARLARDAGIGCLTKPFTDAEMRAALSTVELILRGDPSPGGGGLEIFWGREPGPDEVPDPVGESHADLAVG
jgi:CheY-like chemotaxis protein